MLRHGLDYVLNRDNDSPTPAVNHLAVRTFLGASLYGAHARPWAKNTLLAIRHAPSRLSSTKKSV